MPVPPGTSYDEDQGSDLGDPPVDPFEIPPLDDQTYPPGCSAAPADWRPSTLRWTVRHCDTALCGMFLRVSSAPNGMHESWEAGFVQPVTTHPVRMDWKHGMGNREACRYEVGEFALDEEGHLIAVFGNQPYEELTAIGRAFTAPKTAIHAQYNPGYLFYTLEKGHIYWAAGYVTPRKTEAHYHSTRTVCGAPI